MVCQSRSVRGPGGNAVGVRVPSATNASMRTSLRSARHEAAHDDLAVEREHLLVRVVTLARERVAAREEDEGRALGVDVPQRALADTVADDVGDHGDVLAHELLVQLLDERGEDDLAVAPVDRVDERVLAVVVDARLAEAREALDRGAGLGEDPARRFEPAGEALPHDGAEDLLLVLEVAVERPRGDPGVAGDLRDAGATVAEGGEALLGGGQDAGPGGGVTRLRWRLHEVN